MMYTIQETVDTIGWSQGVDTAPAELVKAAKEMAEKGEMATFGKILHTPSSFTWCILSVKSNGNMIVAKRHLEVTHS
jgi:hypothetical protein